MSCQPTFPIRLFILIAFCLFVAQFTSAQNNNQKIRTKVDEYMKNIRFSGAVLISRDGKPIINKGYGMANYELNAPNTPQTVFLIASLTKQFTAMAIMILKERGKLDVNNSICKYLEDCPSIWQPISVHNLLTNTSGIYNFTETPNFWRKNSALPHSPIELMNLFRDKPLQFTPGEKFAYSNSNYCLLGMIIEKLSGKTFAEFLHENIFTPLGMKNTSFDDPSIIIKNRATGYKFVNNTLVNAFRMNMSSAYAAGGLHSTTEDLLLWDQSFYTEKLVSQKSLKEIFTPFKEGYFKSGYGYAYGWGVGKMFNRLAIEHSGNVHGFTADIVRFPNEHVTIIFLSNIESPDGMDIIKFGDDLSAIVFGESY